jgi:hypothetical protein
MFGVMEDDHSQNFHFVKNIHYLSILLYIVFSLQF